MLFLRSCWITMISMIRIGDIHIISSFLCDNGKEQYCSLFVIFREATLSDHGTSLNCVEDNRT